MSKSEIKVGDIVKITDFSYVTEVTRNGLKELTFSGTSELKDALYKVIEVECVFPKREGQKNVANWGNDTVVINNDEKVFFVQDDQLKKIEAVSVLLEGRPVFVAKEDFVRLISGLKSYFNIIK